MASQEHSSTFETSWYGVSTAKPPLLKYPKFFRLPKSLQRRRRKNRSIILNFSGNARGYSGFLRYSAAFSAALRPLKYAGGMP